jgi:hypothetical protein
VQAPWQKEAGAAEGVIDGHAGAPCENPLKEKPTEITLTINNFFIIILFYFNVFTQG